MKLKKIPSLLRKRFCWLLGHVVYADLGFCSLCRRYKGGRLSKKEALDRSWGLAVKILTKKSNEKKSA